MRKDSARNRARLVEAAREVFAARGFSATLDDIARHAGVGTGTAYRHFANKQAIAAEVLADATTAILDDANAALALDDPWAGLELFLLRNAERQAADRGLYETLTGQGDPELQAAIWPRIIAAVTELVARARAGGQLRADAEVQDVGAIMAMLGPVFTMSRVTGTEVWRRYLALLLDGLRAPGGTGFPVPALPLQEWDVILQAGKHRP
ncbi:TetR/AcrR family transcriptional regulator [Dactylosporangium sp. CS-033363]|uniref:TetR/AcrR family transcriptional regulator n=1 Tax=Dactylosporangium sp. CS-033363 TaxID=3239935 RepID=UPI003D8FE2C1